MSLPVRMRVARPDEKPLELKPPPPKPPVGGVRKPWHHALRGKSLRINIGGSKQRLKNFNSLAVFYRALGAMFHSGIRIDRGLEILSRQAEEPALAEILPQVVRRLWEGQPLSKAMTPYPWIFSPMHVRLIEVGEATGKLHKVLNQIAEYEEKRTAIVMKVKSAMSYPAFLFCSSLVIVVFGPPYMMGGLLKFIQDSHGEVPLLTRMLLAFSNLVQSPYFIGVIALLAYIGMRVYQYYGTHLEKRRELMQRIMKLPYLGRTIRIIAVTRFARSLAVTLATGISPVYGLRMAAESSDNLVLVERIEGAIESLQSGKTLEECLAMTEFFPSAFLSVVKVGEATGEVADVIRRMADLYETELDQHISQLLATMEPIWMLIMGVLIGLISVATMLPIMQMLQHI